MGQFKSAIDTADVLHEERYLVNYSPPIEEGAS